jgi:DNA-binding transcriptional regulator YhcF (GntR family)
VYYASGKVGRRGDLMQYDNRSPIYLQVIDRIIKRMVMGEILPGEKMPSTRVLAVEYEVNPNTAARIYKEMETMGLCYTERGLGTFMTEDKNVVNRLRHELADKMTQEFVREMSSLGFTIQEMKEAIEEEIKQC